MRKIIAAVAIALPLAAHAAIPPGDELANCKAEARAKLARFVVALKEEAPLESWPITLLAVMQAEREIASWMGLDGLDRCATFVRSWLPPPRSEKTARPDYRRRYRSAGNELAPRHIERIQRERQRDREYEHRRRDFERRWYRDHKPYIDKLDKDRPPRRRRSD